MSAFVIVLLVSYVLHGLGITVGYHRLLSHRSFRCAKVVEYFFVLCGYLAFEGSPLWWAAIHRAHHKYVETALDPHSPRYGIMRSWVGWLFETEYPSHIVPEVQCKDLMTNRFYLWLEQGGNIKRMNLLNLTINLGYRGILWAIWGWPIALASILGAFLVMQIPLMLNLICHLPKLGYKNFATADDGVNVWWVGLLGFGEGWHNNHHAYPGSARNGMRVFELDSSWAVIQALRAVGLVTWVNPGPDMKKVFGKNKVVAPAKIPVPTGITPALTGRSVQAVATEARAFLSEGAQLAETALSNNDRLVSSVPARSSSRR